MRGIGVSVIFQLLIFALLIAFSSAVFLVVKSLMEGRNYTNSQERIEEKLDRIIELLEKQNK
jgi:hypothetical protein